MSGTIKERKKLTILFSPLNWGLGHASRCILPVQIFLDAGHTVILAADGEAYFLLKSAFPGLEIIRLKFFSVRYSHFFPIWMKMLFSLPAFFLSIRREHRVLKRLLRQRDIDLVISDNRYGLYVSKVYSVFITHQVFIRLPGPVRFIEGMVYFWHRRRMKKFHALWVPDFGGRDNLAGILSHPWRQIPGHIRYTGPLSRFMHPDFRKLQPVTAKYDVMVILSGPEPHRTILERILIRKLRNTEYRVLLLRGIPWKTSAKRIYDNIRVVTHLDSSLFYTYLSGTRYIIARAGYTTIMDLVALKKKALLIPTPGQPEQEYLAGYLAGREGFVFMRQDEISVEEAFDKLDRQVWDFPATQDDQLSGIIKETVQTIYQSRTAARQKPPRKPR